MGSETADAGSRYFETCNGTTFRARFDLSRIARVWCGQVSDLGVRETIPEESRTILLLKADEFSLGPDRDTKLKKQRNTKIKA